MNYHDELANFGWKTSQSQEHHKYTIPAILSLLPKEKPLNILDVGCGNGFLVNTLSSAGHHVIGIDIAQDGIDIARRAYPHLKFEYRSAYGQLNDLFESPVDVIISSEVIEHVYSPSRFLENLFNTLHPGGYLIVTTPYHGYLKNLVIGLVNGWDRHHDSEREGGHIKFFSETSLGRLLTKNGYSNITYKNSGRIPLLWKSMVCRAQRST